MKKILLIFGTRPEAIKLAPLYKELQKHKDYFQTQICVTAQHRNMLDQVLDFFKIDPDFDLNIMRENQSLFDITVNVLRELEYILNKVKPDLIIVQGDTTTAFAAALAGYYKQIKVAHIEAGLRSDNKKAPFPEEINRILAGHLADFHFAPTLKAVASLKKENIIRNVWQVGNTVIDALLQGLELLNQNNQEIKTRFSMLDPAKRLILVTGHRRENFGKPFQDIAKALLDIIKEFPDTEIIYPLHFNPNVRNLMQELLSNQAGIHLIDPVSYPQLIWLMQQSYLILTDSGGIQEEAPSLGKPVLVMREVTERLEGVEAGTAFLVGTDRAKIFSTASNLLTNQNEYQRVASIQNPYGDGTASAQIVAILMREMIC